LGKDDAVALCTAGISLAHVVGDVDVGASLIDRAMALNPNLAWAWYFSGWVKVFLGEPEAAIELLARAMRLSPQDPYVFNMQTGTALAHLFAGRFDEASSWAAVALREKPAFVPALCAAAVSAAHAGRRAEAENAIACLRQLDPEARVSNLKGWFPIRRPEHIAMWGDGLRKAGLPE
jgi:tetratricopeptide (TPR) repeat protein